MAFEIQISVGSPAPIYRQIADQVRAAMVAGKLSPGDPLPSVRTLAEQLVINPNTVARAYGDLVRDGALESQQGRGMVVARKRQVFTKAERGRRVETALNAFVHEAFFLDFSPDEIREAVERKLSKLMIIKGAGGFDDHD